MKHQFLKYVIRPSLCGAFIILQLFISLSATAQDSRHRVASTIVADGLAQLPAQNLEVMEQVMSEIAGTGGAGIAMLVEYLNDTDEGKGAVFEYAIDGLTSYVSADGREALRPAIVEGLKRGMATAKTAMRKAFYEQQLGKLKDHPQPLPGKWSREGRGSAIIASLRDKIIAAPAKKRDALLLKALKSSDRNVRTNALSLATELGLTGFDAEVVKTYPKLKVPAQADVVRWLGNTHNMEQADVVIAAIPSADSVLATAAIEAAGRIGGEEALKALIGAVDNRYATAATKALTAFNGDIRPGVMAALRDKGALVSSAVVCLAGLRRIREAYQPLTSLLRYARLHDAAATSLAQLVTTETYADLLERFRIYPDSYYALLAQRGEKADIDEIVAAAKGTTHRPMAQAALLEVSDAGVVPQLFEIAEGDATTRDRMLERALTLTQGASLASLAKYQLYKRALEMKPSAETMNRYISALGTLNNEPSLMLAAKFMEIKENDLAAAHAVTTLVAKNEPLQRGAHVRGMLERAKAVFESHTDNADAGYAVDEVNSLLPKIVDDPAAATAKVTTLSEEELSDGFELLFDGTNLDKWKGNKTDYVPIDGAIYVSASYGSEGNLYTQEVYSDFVLRFEFSFVRPGVNNGVGIRTREGVDAAYEGMEIQILDHDDPIYKGLRNYQQHGSVYGIIVPEHVNFGPLGTWNTEEIRAEGDHIRVSVNGRVILDGNIREACQGHNMAPEEGKPNPYTVDHQSHPGLFNRDGLICFCGHGEGLRLRNIRVKRLGTIPNNGNTRKRTERH